ncbi:MAG: peptidase domain-containing ABC transporter [Synechococcales cyanobacterium C42_A2020_086]|jgi:ATP-binding cassette subfamily C protein|nr:peptidase domain-containing ABC transporter [Synechococcales cyanobacterium C42_A2020_086]
MKYSLVQQHSREDCGAACLTSIAKHYGRTFSLTRVREVVGTGQLGTTLLGLRRGTEALGFYARSAVASEEILDCCDRLPLPAILHWQGRHWVVWYGVHRGRYVIADPAKGVRYLSKADLLAGWSDRVILLLEPDPNRFFQQPEEHLNAVGQLLARLAPYRTTLLEALLCITLIGLLSLASPFFIQLLTDNVLIRGDTQLLRGIVIAVLVLYLIRGGLAFVSDMLIAHFAQRLELGLILDFGQRILQLPLTYYETRRSGEVVSRLRDIEEINQLVAQVIVTLPSAGLIALVSLGLMLVYSWKLTLLALLVAVIMSGSTILFQPMLRQQTRRAMTLQTENQGLLVETFKGALTLKTTLAASQVWDELQGRFGQWANLMLSTTRINVINRTFSRVVADGGSTLLLGLGSLLVINQELTIGQLLAFTSLNRNITYFMDDVIDVVDDLVRVQTANLRLQEVVQATLEAPIDAPKPWVTLPNDVEIRCADLTFHYPGRIDLLQKISLTIPGGQVVALIGPSGCGKSTLAKVLAGLYTVDSGTIRLGDYNLQDLALECVRQQVVLVPQDAHFWSRSILENFRLGSPYLDFEQIVSACQLTGADDFISCLPERYQTVLGEFGANLSGGQRQRLAIARALVNDPPVLILDESTSGLDPISEANLLRKLLQHRQGKTTILISHRPQVIRQAEWIIVLADGQVKLQGTPAQIQAEAGEHLHFLVPSESSF